MTHVQGFVNAFVTRFLASGASADPLGRNLDPARRGRTINLLTFTALKSDAERREEQNLFDKTGALKNFRSTLVQMVKNDEAIQVEKNLARGDPRIGIPPGSENQSSSPSLGI